MRQTIRFLDEKVSRSAWGGSNVRIGWSVIFNVPNKLKVSIVIRKYILWEMVGKSYWIGFQEGSELSRRCVFAARGALRVSSVYPLPR
jgi:hypothetical protein